MALSTKDYENVAERLKRLPISDSVRMLVAAELGQQFGEENPLFDLAKFTAACQPDAGTAPVAIDPESLTRILIDYLRAGATDDLPTLSSIVDVAREGAFAGDPS